MTKTSFNTTRGMIRFTTAWVVIQLLAHCKAASLGDNLPEGDVASEQRLADLTTEDLNVEIVTNQSITEQLQGEQLKNQSDNIILASVVEDSDTEHDKGSGLNKLNDTSDKKKSDNRPKENMWKQRPSLKDKNPVTCLDKTEGYRRRPNSVVIVEVSVYVISISALNLEKMELQMDFYLEQGWRDERCRFVPMPGQGSEVTLQGHGIEDLNNLQNHLWMPDTYVVNAKETKSHDVPMPQQSTKVAQDGYVTHTSRVTVLGSCPMSLWLFPFDRQMCSFQMQSFSFSNREVRFAWREEELHFEYEMEYQDKMLPDVRIVGYRLTEDSLVSREKNRSQLQMDIFLERPLGHYLFELYLPAVCIVFMSWINFWLSRSAAAERVGLGMTIVLTLTTHMASANSNLPKTSYPKAIGIYLSACFIFTFAGLVENIIAAIEKKIENPTSQLRQKLEQKRIRKLMKSEGCRAEDLDAMSSLPGTPLTSVKDPIRTYQSFQSYGGLPDQQQAKELGLVKLTRSERMKEFIWPKTVDQKSRLYFPLTFVIFNIIYWSICLSTADPLPHDVIHLRN